MRSNRVAISLSNRSSGWHFERIIVDGLEAPYRARTHDSAPSTPSTRADFLLLHAAAVNNVDVKSVQIAALAVEKRLSLEELHGMAPTQTVRAFTPSRCNSASLSDGPWSGAWEATASFEGLAALQTADSPQQFTLQTASNWGALSVDWQTDGEQQTVAFSVAAGACGPCAATTG